MTRKFASSFTTGTYTGDGNATQAITGLGFKPRVVMIVPTGTPVASYNDWWIKTEQHSGTASFDGYLGDVVADCITSLDSDGFTVGDGTGDGQTTHPNVLNQSYIYIAWA